MRTNLIQTYEDTDLTGTLNLDLGGITEGQNLPLNAGDFLALRIGHVGYIGHAFFAEVYGWTDVSLNSDPGDPAKIVGIPEPATLAALGLGCLPALLRRRR